MPKWTEQADRDLVFAILHANFNIMDSGVKIDWAKVHDFMKEWNWEFTKDAINQRWSKTIMKDFKAAHEKNGSNKEDGNEHKTTVDSMPAATPRKRARAGEGAVKSGGKSKGKTDPAADEMEDESDTTTPTKKRKAPKQGRGGKPIEDEIAVAMPV